MPRSHRFKTFLDWPLPVADSPVALGPLPQANLPRSNQTGPDLLCRAALGRAVQKCGPECSIRSGYPSGAVAARRHACGCVCPRHHTSVFKAEFKPGSLGPRDRASAWLPGLKRRESSPDYHAAGLQPYHQAASCLQPSCQDSSPWRAFSSGLKPVENGQAPSPAAALERPSRAPPLRARGRRDIGPVLPGLGAAHLSATTSSRSMPRVPRKHASHRPAHPLPGKSPAAWGPADEGRLRSPRRDRDTARTVMGRRPVGRSLLTGAKPEYRSDRTTSRHGASGSALAALAPAPGSARPA